MNNRRSLESLSKLSQKELQEINNKTTFLLQNFDIVEKVNRDVEILYSCIKNEIELLLKKRQPDFRVVKLKQKQVYKKIIKLQTSLKSYLKELIENPTKDILKEWYMLYSRLVCGHLFNSKESLSVGHVIDKEELFPQILNKAFPDYISSGFIQLLFTDRIKNHDR